MKTFLNKYTNRDMALLGVFISYIILVFIIIQKHEPWFDEAQMWLISRDSTIKDVISYTRYEGVPALFYLLLMIPAKLGIEYEVMNLIYGTIATCGVYVFLRYSPFPIVIKVIFPFTYFMFYQYCVVSRHYVIFAPLLFVIATNYKDKNDRPFLYACLIFLLSNVSAHAWIISFCLLVFWMFDLLKSKFYLCEGTKKLILAVTLTGILLLLSMVQIYPVPIDKIPCRDFSFDIMTLFSTTNKVISGVFVGETLISWLFFFLFCLWFYYRRVLMLFLVPIFFLCVFFAIVTFKVWHEGIFFFWIIFALWLSLQNNEKCVCKVKFLDKIVLSSIWIFFVVHVTWAYTASKNDFLYPYSGSKKVAEYIKSQNATNLKIYATGFHSIAILPYFDINIFTNHNNGNDTSFFLWSLRNNNMIREKVDGIVDKGPYDFSSILKYDPELIIVGIKFQTQLRQLTIPNYKLDKIFKGNIFWKNKILEKDSFYIFLKKMENKSRI